MNFFNWQPIFDQAKLGLVKQQHRQSNHGHQETWYVQSSSGEFFIKTLPKRQHIRLQAEADGLTAIANSHSIECPTPITLIEDTKQVYLVLPWLHLVTDGDWSEMATALARLHRHTHTSFGWPTTNFIGGSIQYNHSLEDWPSFYRSQRLLPQLKWAKERGLANKHILAIEQIMDNIETYFTGYQPNASLLHGDLWHGNLGFTQQGKPIIFDPACYYGDRETDIAMTKLFGALPNSFYLAYEEAWPLHTEAKSREPLYHLYHYLNHFNLFGSQYITSIASCLSQLK